MPAPPGSGFGFGGSNTDSRGYGGFGGSGSGYGGVGAGAGGGFGGFGGSGSGGVGAGAGASGGFGGGNFGGGSSNSTGPGNYGGGGYGGWGSGSANAATGPQGYGGLGGLIGGMGGLPGALGGIGAFGSPSVPGGLWGASSDYGKPRQNPLSDPSRFRFGGPFGITREALAGVDPSTLSRLVGLQAAYGKPIGIRSAFRDVARNKKAKGAKNSQHILGKAFDLDLPEKTIGETKEFVGLASKFGFGGIGVYGPGSVHVDTGPVRGWGPNRSRSSIPGWASGTMASHFAGAFGTAPQNMAQAPSVPSVASPSASALAGLGLAPGASVRSSLNPSVNPSAGYGVGPSASATGGVSVPGATASAATTPTYSETAPSWWDSTKDLAKVGWNTFTDANKKINSIPGGAKTVMAMTRQGGASKTNSGGEGGHYSDKQNAQMRSKLAEFVNKKVAKPKGKEKEKKGGGFTFKTPTTIFPKYSQADWLKSLRFS